MKKVLLYILLKLYIFFYNFCEILRKLRNVINIYYIYVYNKSNG